MDDEETLFEFGARAPRLFRRRNKTYYSLPVESGFISTHFDLEVFERDLQVFVVDTLGSIFLVRMLTIKSLDDFGGQLIQFVDGVSSLIHAFGDRSA